MVSAPFVVAGIILVLCDRFRVAWLFSGTLPSDYDGHASYLNEDLWRTTGFALPLDHRSEHFHIPFRCRFWSWAD